MDIKKYVDEEILEKSLLNMKQKTVAHFSNKDKVRPRAWQRRTSNYHSVLKTLNSTRRFIAQPSLVALSATGWSNA